MSFSVKARVADNINYAASHQEKQKIVVNILIEEADPGTYVLRIYSEPAFLFEYKDSVTITGTSLSITAPKISINDSFYRTDLIEAQDGQIRIELFDPEDPDVILGFQHTSVHIQPYLHWDRLNYPESLPAFCQPNDPLVQLVMKKAGEYAAAEGRSMSGYQCRTREGVKKQAGYIYRALQDMKIHYLSAPASFEKTGQKVRIPHQVLHEGSRQGTCLDLAILYATCIEAASMNAVIVVIPGHAFSGVWLEDVAFGTSLVKPSSASQEAWSKAMEIILPVECTTFTAGSSTSFESAVTLARGDMPRCMFLCDVAGARKINENPVYTYTDVPICNEPDQAEEDESIFVREEYAAQERSRIEQLRDQSMDLTVRSPLLNGASGGVSLSFDIDTSDFLRRLASSNEASRRELSDLIMEKISSIGKKGRKNNSSVVCRELYSKSVQADRETGKRNLYVALNELVWRHDNGKTCSAVMYLCPVEMYRNRRGEYRARLTSEKTFFNPALKALLNQRYHLDSSVLVDMPGENYAEQMKYLKYLIEAQNGWKIREDIARMSLYHVPNEAVWNGLNDSGLIRHEIVAGILKGEMNWDQEIAGGETADDNRTGIYAFQTDSSQEQIIASAFRNKAQVVLGPAGNGKTQTVVNIMLEAARKGQTVLFVSEKAPAMEVVCEKLNEVLSGRFNLKITKGRNETADFLRQLRVTMEYLVSAHGLDIPQTDDQTERYIRCLEELNHYYELMRTKGKCGKSLEELINMLEKYSDVEDSFTLDEEMIAIPLQDAEEQIGVFVRLLEERGKAEGNYSEYIKYENLDNEEEITILHSVQSAISKYNRLAENARRLSDKLGGGSNIGEIDMISWMYDASGLLSSTPLITSGESYEDSEEPCEDLEELRRISKKKEEEDIRVLIGEMRRLSTTPPIFRKKLEDKCRKLLQKKYTSSESRKMIDEYLEDPESVISELKGEKLPEKEREYSGHNLTGMIRRYDSFREEAVAKVRGMHMPEKLRNGLLAAIEQTTMGKTPSLKEEAEEIIHCYKDYAAAQKEADEKVIKNVQGFKKKNPDTPRKVLYEEWIANRNKDQNRLKALYKDVTDKMGNKGYAEFICQAEELYSRKPMTREEILDGYHKAWATGQIKILQDTLFDNYQISHLVFLDRIDQLSEREEEIRRQLMIEIGNAILGRMPNIEEGVSNNREFGIIEKFMRKKNTPIRTFFESAPNMLHTIFPCMIMDPQAVAEYIPAEYPPFDLVIIDEGSQMPAYNALIPISHSVRCMIFGDEKQLQPIDDFKMRGEDMYGTKESILTSAIVTSMPRKMLRFHYRSENESLISFSNKKYYNNNIVTFPSADTSIMGVSYELVENGIYDRDRHVNLTEAEKVIERIRRIYEDIPANGKLTLGVITFNVHQRDLIHSLLLEQINANTELGRKTDELVSVVNLESCQGKEWDYVILSPGFGMDQKGKFPREFGGLNREYGSNRLNVMLTRARRQMIVITSIEPHMLSNARSEGVRDFREFLLFAKGDMVLDSRVYKHDKRKAGLIDSVAERLESEGYEVHSNIGSSGFKIDIGIVSRDDDRKYALGILTDHYSDRRSSIHDREVIFPRILRSKGWKIYRLCGLNWLNDPEHELERIRRIMEAD